MKDVGRVQWMLLLIMVQFLESTQVLVQNLVQIRGGKQSCLHFESIYATSRWTSLEHSMIPVVCRDLA